MKYNSYFTRFVVLLDFMLSTTMLNFDTHNFEKFANVKENHLLASSKTMHFISKDKLLLYYILLLQYKKLSMEIKYGEEIHKSLLLSNCSQENF